MTNKVTTAFKMSFMVGSILILVNQGDLIFTGVWSPALLIKIMLTPLVPFCVSLLSAWMNEQRHQLVWEQVKQAASKLADKSSHQAKVTLAEIVAKVKQIKEGSVRVAQRADNVYDGLLQAVDLFEKLKTKISGFEQTIAKETTQSYSKKELAQNQIKESTEKLKQSIQVNSTHLESVNTTLDKIRGSVENSVNSVDLLDRRLESLKSVADRLTTVGESIQSITQTIIEVVNSTNMLAINAAIEASKAGEHGIGFAVVAEEVRKLADKTKQATLEINNYISQSQSTIKETEEGVKNGIEAIAVTKKAILSCQELVEESSTSIQIVNSSFKSLDETSKINFQSIGDICSLLEKFTSLTNEIKDSVQNSLSDFPKVESALEKSRDNCEANRNSPGETRKKLEAIIDESNNLDKILHQLPESIQTEGDRIRQEYV